MKKIIFSLLLFLALNNSNAQILEPVKWATKIEKINQNQFNLIFTAQIEKDWHVYSQFTPEGGPLPIEIDFQNQNNNYKLIGKTAESKTHKAFNDVFGVDEIYFEKNIVLTQKIERTNPKLTTITAQISYQVCKTSCINDQKKLEFKLPNSIDEVQTKAKDTATVTIANSIQTSAKETTQNQQTTKTEPQKNQKQVPKTGFWSLFLATLLAGLLATITPCVFPMIPMTVSYFLKQSAQKSKGRFNAFFYGFCIIAIYVLISLPFHIFESLSPDIFSEISTNVYLNIFFFVVFVVFAASFFGAFEITIPTKLSDKADNASNSGGLIGIFFMALTLIIVSFSCTGPALGLVLGSVLSSDGGATLLTIAMFGFGFGLALPFISLALFPNLISNLPKSGGWLNTIKVVFGFIELALAFKFLSNADLVLQAHWLDREVFLAIWIAIFALLSYYLFGKLRLPHDTETSSISVGRMLAGLVALSFTIYMIPGLWGAPLQLVSAFAPPQIYSESPAGITNTTTKLQTNLPNGATIGPNNLVVFEDYTIGLAYAKTVNKPILLDFTGRACQNCRLMESNVWANPEVLELLQNQVVIISLYCDERTELPTEEQYTSTQTQSKITTVGQKWTEFQRQNYSSNARPFYVLTNTSGQKLNQPIGYTPDIQEYLKWLKSGIHKK